MVKIKEHLDEIASIKEALKGDLSPKRRYDLGRRLIRLEKDLRDYERYKTDKTR